MKKLLLVATFLGLMMFSEQVSAQTYREPVQTSQKTDDGVLVAYPNPAKDFIILRAKNSNLKIKTVTFYSILGLQVQEINVNMNAAEIRLDKLRPGKYLMRYTLSDNSQKVTQIIKQ